MLVVGHAIVWSFYLLIGLFGYYTFGDMTPSNILNAYPSDSAVANIARIGLAIALVTSYPLVNLGVRDAASSIVRTWCCLGGSDAITKASVDGAPENSDKSLSLSTSLVNTTAEVAEGTLGALIDCDKTRACASTADLAFTTLVGIAVSDVAIVLSFVGATGSTIMGIIAPGFLYFYLFRDPNAPKGQLGWRRTVALAVGCFGILLSLTGITLTVKSLVMGA